MTMAVKSLDMKPVQNKCGQGHVYNVRCAAENGDGRLD